MNNITKNRLLSVLVLLLLLANIASLATFWWKKEQAPPERNQISGSASDYLVKELGFDSIQKVAYMQLRKEHQQNIEGLMEKTKAAKETFFGLLNKDSISNSELQQASMEAAKQDQQRETYTFEHFRKVRALCNETQKKKFDSIIQQVLRMMGGPPPGHPPGDGPPPGNHPPPMGDRPPPPGDRPPPPDGEPPRQ